MKNEIVEVGKWMDQYNTSSLLALQHTFGIYNGLEWL